MFIPPDYGDYEHRDDYDPEGVEWIDVTRISRAHEHQIAANRDDHRHRHVSTCGPWKKGPPP